MVQVVLWRMRQSKQSRDFVLDPLKTYVFGSTYPLCLDVCLSYIKSKICKEIKALLHSLNQSIGSERNTETDNKREMRERDGTAQLKRVLLIYSEVCGFCLLSKHLIREFSCNQNFLTLVSTS